MTAESITTLAWGYVFVAIFGSLVVALVLEERFKKRLPATRPYVWGFYCGCMGVACGPLAAVTALATAVAAKNEKWEVFGSCLVSTIYFVLHAVCGWFIMRRKRWAWGLGTVLTLNMVVWVINYTYGRKRWGEFGGQAYGFAGTEEEGYELVHDATKLEAGGRVQEALALYERIAERYPGTAAGSDAQKSAQSLQATVGLECKAPAEATLGPSPLERVGVCQCLVGGRLRISGASRIMLKEKTGL